MPKTITLYDDEGVESTHSLPTRKIVCPSCNGEGKSSAYLGSFCRSDLDADPEFAEAYFRGDYDRVCPECRGLRVVDEVDMELLERTNPTLALQYSIWLHDEAQYNALCEMERRMGA